MFKYYLQHAFGFSLKATLNGSFVSVTVEGTLNHRISGVFFDVILSKKMVLPNLYV